MIRGDEHRIADILDAAQKLSDRLTIDFDAWVEDEDLRLITERLVEIIGRSRQGNDSGRSSGLAGS